MRRSWRCTMALGGGMAAIAASACSWVSGLSQDFELLSEPPPADDGGLPEAAPCGDTQRDPQHCGVCNRRCAGACIDGVCEASVIAAGQANPSRIQVDDTGIYWTNQTSNGAVMKCQHGGCPGGPAALASNQPRPYALTFYRDTVVWTTLDDGKVRGIPKQGGTIVPYSALSPIAPTGSVFVDPSSLFGIGSQFLLGSRTDGWFHICSHKPPDAFGICERPASLSSNEPTLDGMRGDPARYFWLREGHRIRTCVAGPCGQTREDLVASTEAVSAFLVDQNFVFWSTGGPGGFVRRGSLRFGGADAGFDAQGNSTNLASQQAGAVAMAQDATHVYWANSLDGTIHKLEKQAENPADIVLARGQKGPSDIAVFGDDVFWTNAIDGTVATTKR